MTKEVSKEDAFVYNLITAVDEDVVEWCICDDNNYKMESGTILTMGDGKISIYFGIYISYFLPHAAGSIAKRDKSGKYTLEVNKQKINASESALRALWVAVKAQRDRGTRQGVLKELDKAAECLNYLQEKSKCKS